MEMIDGLHEVLNPLHDLGRAGSRMPMPGRGRLGIGPLRSHRCFDSGTGKIREGLPALRAWRGA